MENKNTNQGTATVGNILLSDAVFRPMLFSTPMVQSLLNGTKTQTRRIIKNCKSEWCFDGMTLNSSEFVFITSAFGGFENFKPVANKGDIIWVRETYLESFIPAFGEPMTWLQLEYGASEQTIRNIIYKADFPNISVKWKPSLFMPKSACRLWLKVTNVRVERLQDISEEDAENEGLEKDYSTFFDTNRQYSFPDYNTPRTEIKRGKKIKISSGLFKYAVDSYKSLWQKINVKDSWDSNPFVWVYDFEVIREAPYGFR